MILMIPIILTVYRLHRIKKGAQYIGYHEAIMTQFGYIFVDLVTLFLLIFVTITMWRLPTTYRKFKQVTILK